MTKGFTLSHDGISLKYAFSDRNEGKPWIVLIMPFGLELELAEPFFEFYESQYSVLTWESRSILERSDRISAESEFSVENHVADLLSVMDAREVAEAALVGYCSGAGIALAAANRAPNRFSNLALVHGEYTLLDDPACTTQFATDIDSLLSMAAGSEERARLVFERVKSERLAGGPEVPAGIDVPFTDLRFLRRHARNYLAYKSVDFRHLASAVGHRTLLLTGKRDMQANVDSTRRIGEAMANSEIYVDPDADHYGLVRRQSKTMIAIWNYLGEQADCYA